jgi:hypothetical protein
LQGIGLPDFIKNFINSNNHVFWYFRFHPRYPEDIKDIKELVDQNIDKTDIILANELSLHTLLSQVDYHLTCFSGSAIEAEVFGVQNIIYGKDGLLAYSEYIEDGSFFYVKSESNLQRIFSSNEKNNNQKAALLFSHERIKQVIKTVFDSNVKY